MRILLIPGTTQIAAEYLRAIKPSRNSVLYGAGSDLFHNLCSEYEDYDFLSRDLNEIHPRVVQRLIQKHSIDVVVPCHDDWVVTLSQMAKQLEAVCIVPTPENSLVLRSKRATYLKLSKSISLPQTFTDVDTIVKYPVFIKPDKGQGSRNTQLINSVEELKHLVGDSSGIFQEEWVVSEFLSGAEFTVDNFTDIHGRLLYSSTRQRIMTHSGISSHTKTFPEFDDSNWARNILECIPITGAWFFQYKFNSEGKAKLLEVAARPAGASGINRLFGINLPLLNVQQAMGHNLEIVDSKEVVTIKKSDLTGELDAFFQSRRFNKVYVNFDDTLVSWKNVTPTLTPVVEFIKRAKAPNRQFILISKHRGPLLDLLATFHIKSLFDQIIHITDSTSKVDLMEVSDSDTLFIDDSFSERRQAKQRFGASIVTIDPSAFSYAWQIF